jgi:hypothetical protein
MASGDSVIVFPKPLGALLRIFSPPALTASICAPAALVAFVLLATATWKGGLRPSEAAVLIVLAGLTLASFVLFVMYLSAGVLISIESHWGGLGGGLGGWRISSTLAMLLIMIGSFAALCTVAMRIQSPAAAPDLIERYRAVVNLARSKNASITRDEVVGRKLLFSATTDETTRNQLWDLIKIINPAFDDIAADIQITKSRGAGGAARN